MRFPDFGHFVPRHFLRSGYRCRSHAVKILWRNLWKVKQPYVGPCLQRYKQSWRKFVHYMPMQSEKFNNQPIQFFGASRFKTDEHCRKRRCSSLAKLSSNSNCFTNQPGGKRYGNRSWSHWRLVSMCRLVRQNASKQPSLPLLKHQQGKTYRILLQQSQRCCQQILECRRDRSLAYCSFLALDYYCQHLYLLPPSQKKTQLQGQICLHERWTVRQNLISSSLLISLCFTIKST